VSIRLLADADLNFAIVKGVRRDRTGPIQGQLRGRPNGRDRFNFAAFGMTHVTNRDISPFAELDCGNIRALLARNVAPEPPFNCSGCWDAPWRSCWLTRSITPS
jgi:hypothetical protein